MFFFVGEPKFSHARMAGPPLRFTSGPKFLLTPLHTYEFRLGKWPVEIHNSKQNILLNKMSNFKKKNPLLTSKIKL